MICTFIVATVSFLVMFYYSVNFTKYTQLGIKYVTALKSRNLSRDLHGEVLSSNNSTASSNIYNTNTSKEGKIDVVNSIQPSLRAKPTGKKSVFEDVETLKTSNNSLKSTSTTETKLKVSTTAKPISTPSSKGSDIAQDLCPEKSSSLGESCVLFILSKYHGYCYIARKHRHQTFCNLYQVR